MTIYEKIEKIENSIISLAGDRNSKGDYGKETDKYVSKDKMEKVIKPRIKKEKLFLKQEVIESDIKIENYNETKKYFDKSTKMEKIDTYEKVMYIAKVKMLFTFIDTQTGEEVSFQFSASANNNSNGGNAYGSALSYAIRNFYKTIFNIVTGNKDKFTDETPTEKDLIKETEEKEIIEEPHPLQFKSIDGEKEYYNSGTGWGPLNADDKPIGKTKAIEFAKNLKDNYPRIYEFKINQIKMFFKLDKLENLTLNHLKKLEQVQFDIDSLIKGVNLSKAV